MEKNAWLDSLVWGGKWVETPGLSTSGGAATISIKAVSGSDPYGVLSGSSLIWDDASLAALLNSLVGWERVANNIKS
jgi:hypothetical protein